MRLEIGIDRRAAEARRIKKARCRGTSVVQIGMLALVCLLFVGCAQPVDNEGPVAVVRQFVGALEARDPSAIIALLEPTEWRAEIGPELRSYLGYLEALDLREEAYTVAENSGDTALVRVTGTLSYTLEEGASGEIPVDLQLQVVRIDGIWYLRDLELPQPGV